MRSAALPLGLGLAAVAAAAAPAGVAEALRYDRAAVEAGQVWRLLTCHLVHLGPRHLAGNLLALAAVWTVFQRELARGGARITLITAAGVGLGLHWLQPDLARYVGLSGVWHGLLAAGAAAAWSERRAVTLAVAALLGAKLLYEQWAGPLPGAEAMVGGTIAVAAHLYGAASGFGSAQAERLWASSSRASCT
jgi:rhomboid family GlyGly-CTERM serine protease